jgi:selenide,water dikinase
VCGQAGTFLAGGHSIDDREPKYGLAVTGIGHPDHLLRNDAGRAGTPLTLTKPLGLGILNNRHKVTGEDFPEAVAVMTTLNREASAAALDAGARCATDVTGFGLLGHLFKLVRASGVSAVVDSAAVPYVDGARASLAEGFVPGGSRRNLEWVRPHLDAAVGEDELVLLADAQTSGGLLVAGELPGHPVVGELVPADTRGPRITVR